LSSLNAIKNNRGVACNLRVILATLSRGKQPLAMSSKAINSPFEICRKLMGKDIQFAIDF
jgi:hypothetical protein